MRLTKLIAAAAALSMVATPALAAKAAPSPAAKLSIAKNVRASSPSKGSSALADGPSTITALILGGLVVAGIIVAATSGNDDQPDSP